MKNFNFRRVFFLVFAFILCGFVGAIAQSPGEVIEVIKDADSWEVIFSASDAILGAVIMIGGYITPLIPGLNAIPKKTYQVLALAIILIVIFIKFGSTTLVSGPVIYAVVTSLYELFLKPLSKLSE